jgi:hypothetical protein
MSITVKSPEITITVEAPTIVYSLSLSASKTSVAAGGTVDFTATLTSVKPLKKPLSDANVSLYENNTQSEGSSTTNSSGIAQFSVKMPSAGTYSFVAKYTTKTGTTASNVVNVKVTGKTQPTPTYELTLSASSDFVTTYTPVTFTIKLMETQPVSEPVSNAIVDLFANGSRVASATTNTSGIATVSASFDSAGTYDVDAVWNGNTSNDQTVEVGSIKIKSPPPPTTGTGLTQTLKISSPPSSE